LQAEIANKQEITATLAVSFLTKFIIPPCFRQKPKWLRLIIFSLTVIMKYPEPFVNINALFSPCYGVPERIIRGRIISFLILPAECKQTEI